jgi:hypothetical protein
MAWPVVSAALQGPPRRMRRAIAVRDHGDLSVWWLEGRGEVAWGCPERGRSGAGAAGRHVEPVGQAGRQGAQDGVYDGDPAVY